MNGEKILRLFVFINLHIYGFTKRLFNVKLNEFKTIINKVNNKKELSVEEKSKLKKIYISITKYCKWIINSNKLVINNIDFDETLKKINKKDYFWTITDDDINFISNVINFWFSLVWDNEIRNTIKHWNAYFNPDKLLTILNKAPIDLYNELKNSVDSKYPWLFCLSFFLPKKLIKQYIDIEDNYLLNINSDISYIDYKINMKWNDNNHVCQNFKNNLLSLKSDFEKCDNNQSNYYNIYQNIWNNIYKVLYFHASQYNQDHKNDKYIILYSNMDKVYNPSINDAINNDHKIYKHLPKNFLAIMDKKIIYKTKIFKPDEKAKYYKNLINFSINQKTIINFFKEKDSSIFDYESFKKFIQEIINKYNYKNSNKKQNNDSKQNKFTLKMLNNRIYGNFRKWGEKLFLIKNLKLLIQITKNACKQFTWRSIIKDFEEQESTNNVTKEKTQELLNLLKNSIKNKNKKNEFEKRFSKIDNYLNLKKDILISEGYYRFEEIKPCNNEGKRSNPILKHDYIKLLDLNINDIVEYIKKHYMLTKDGIELIDKYNNKNINLFFRNLIKYVVAHHYEKLKKKGIGFDNTNSDKNNQKKPKKNKYYFAWLKNKNKQNNNQLINEKYSNFFDTELAYYIYENNLTIKSFLDNYIGLRKELFNGSDVEDKKLKSDISRLTTIIDHLLEENNAISKQNVVFLIFKYSKLKMQKKNFELIDLVTDEELHKIFHFKYQSK